MTWNLAQHLIINQLFIRGMLKSSWNKYGNRFNGKHNNVAQDVLLINNGDVCFKAQSLFCAYFVSLHWILLVVGHGSNHE